MCECVMYVSVACTCHCAHTEVRRQLYGLGSLCLLLPGFQGWSPDLQACMASAFLSHPAGRASRLELFAVQNRFLSQILTIWF